MCYARAIRTTCDVHIEGDAAAYRSCRGLSRARGTAWASRARVRLCVRPAADEAVRPVRSVRSAATSRRPRERGLSVAR